MIKRLLAFRPALRPAVAPDRAAARGRFGAQGRRVEANKDYTRAPGGWKPLGAEGDASVLDEGLRLRLA